MRFLLVLLLSSAPVWAFPALPAPPIPRPLDQLRDPRVAPLQDKIRRAQIFDAYRQLIAIYKSNGYFAEAARLHREQAALYRRKKLNDAAIIEDNRAFALETDLRIFADIPTTAKAAGKLFTGATNEPILGCYNGAFIDRDDGLGPAFKDENWQTHRSPAQWVEKTGQTPGSLFMYVRYGQKFPAAWVARLKSAGAIPHIAWEPTSLNAVQDDKYLRDFANATRDADWPIFFRFASEMNGSWTPYHGNPALYKEKFRLVHRVLHQYAPRAATIWCVNNPPLGNAFDYYPGDDGCDWVGVNFYAVPFHENRRDKPAFDENPLALLEPIYRRFSAQKPIAICEFAASHQAGLDKKPIPNFAIEKLSQLYGALPLVYPRIKLVDWFDMNTIRYPTPGKTSNNYLLTENPQVLAAWRRETASNWFLKSRQTLGEALPPLARPVANQKLKHGSTIRIWAQTYVARPKLWVQLDGKTIGYEQKTGAHELVLPVLSPGSHSLTALLYDDKNRFVKTVSARFSVVN